jgi:hypothetical protein
MTQVTMYSPSTTGGGAKPRRAKKQARKGKPKPKNTKEHAQPSSSPSSPALEDNGRHDPFHFHIVHIMFLPIREEHAPTNFPPKVGTSNTSHV